MNYGNVSVGCASLTSMPRRSSIVKDEIGFAKSILDEIIEETESEDFGKNEPQKNPAAVALGRLGGQKGGKARAAKLSPKERSKIAKKAATARWQKD